MKTKPISQADAYHQLEIEKEAIEAEREESNRRIDAVVEQNFRVLEWPVPTTATEIEYYGTLADFFRYTSIFAIAGTESALTYDATFLTLTHVY